MYSKVDAGKRRRMWLESMADRGGGEYAFGVRPVATREARQPPAHPRRGADARMLAPRTPPLPPAASGS